MLVVEIVCVCIVPFNIAENRSARKQSFMALKKARVLILILSIFIILLNISFLVFFSYS